MPKKSLKAKENKNMDLAEVRKIVPKNGERYIIVENGKPVLVLMSFEDYQDNFSKRQKEIQFKPASPSAAAPQEKKREGELTVEDLPF